MKPRFCELCGIHIQSKMQEIKGKVICPSCVDEIKGV